MRLSHPDDGMQQVGDIQGLPAGHAGRHPENLASEGKQFRFSQFLICTVQAAASSLKKRDGKPYAAPFRGRGHATGFPSAWKRISPPEAHPIENPALGLPGFSSVPTRPTR